MFLEEIINLAPYSLKKAEKSQLLNDYLGKLTRHHYERCGTYAKMIDGFGYDLMAMNSIYDLPFLPVRLFKIFKLMSISEQEVVKTMTSSGTTGQEVSRIYLDRNTAANQTKVLSRIVSSFIGIQRVPMLIIDTDEVVKNRNLFSARGAGILGFSMFGSKRFYALDSNMDLRTDAILEFLDKHKGQRIFIFGFTFIIWQHFYKRVIAENLSFDLSNALLIHGGGWKKLISESISSAEFNRCLNSATGLNRVHDYYGMVEQTGSIFMECEYNYLHTPVYSDIIIRRPHDFSVAGVGEVGIIQVLSILPSSYPGHSLLTEDEGVLLGEDNCNCGRPGKYFKIIGRLKNAEIRGCSDAYGERFR